MSFITAKIAVSGATYWIDRPYEYLVPDEFAGTVVPGMRVFVPFSRGNRRCEGIILALSQSETDVGLKSIEAVLDSEPVLTGEQIKLALFMRERFFCTVYDAFKAILPAGLWFDSSGKRRVKDKNIEIVKLNIPCEEAFLISEEKKRKSPQQSNILRELSVFGQLPASELMSFTGAGRSSLKALIEQEIVSTYMQEAFRRPEIFNGDLQELPSLTKEQSVVYETLLDKAQKYEPCVSLLQGVTGSGKTSIYIKLISDVLSDGKSVILLVPEIALTPQMIATFSGYFGNDIAVLHSSLTQAERYDEWKRVKNSDARLVIGTRSAVFAPCSNLGLIIIDEEQEDTYKSDNSPRYNAHDIAKYRCYKSGCLLLLGSATPNVCSRYMAQIGKYDYCRLDKRYNAHNLPEVKIVDMKAELVSGNSSLISGYLKDEIQKNLDRGEQSILFLNRRGAHKLITCSQCGYVYKCPNCSVSLTYHSVGNKLLCHYCGYTKKVDSLCPDCGGELSFTGAGTQLVEEELKKIFPGIGVLRIDADVISSSVTHEKIFDEFRNQQIPVLIGTQMVTKGLNFENVTLVGVLSADQSLYVNDYRASERTFSLITQVIGRSGRGDKLGRAVIQTFTPENEVILQAAKQDFDDFYKSEIKIREIQHSPPFCDYLSITVSGKYERDVINASNHVKRLLQFNLKDKPECEILGPVPLNVVKVNNVFRYRINLKCVAGNDIRKIISNVIIACNNDKNLRGLSFYADNDPND